VAVVLEGVVGAVVVLVGVPAHWRKKRTMEASAWRRGRWGWRQLLVASEFPIGFPPDRDR
jgi:hypothetical protein